MGGSDQIWMRRCSRSLLLTGLVGLCLSLSACERASDKVGAGKDKPVEVGYVVAQPTRVALITELSGRTVASTVSEVRPQISGVIEKRLFTEGAQVRRGQPLYQIDASLQRAAVVQAQADLDGARANQEAAQALADRYKPLLATGVVSKQNYANALAAARQAASVVAQRQAVLETARINLRFTTVPAPISGQIGRSLVTVGGLVTNGQAEPLATIQQLDPIYVDIAQSAADLVALRRALPSHGAKAEKTEVKLILEDGGEYAQTGVVEFSEAVVDQSTGTVTLRARMPNPHGLLLPGMFVRARFSQASDAQAFLVPQQAVSRDPKGGATVYIVTSDNHAEQRKVLTKRAQGAFWVVTEGLKPGDRVIVEGLGKIKPKSALRPVQAGAPQALIAKTGG